MESEEHVAFYSRDSRANFSQEKQKEFKTTVQQYYYPIAPDFMDKTIITISNCALIPTHSHVFEYNAYLLKDYQHFQYNPNKCTYNNLHDFARRGYEHNNESQKRFVPRPRSEYIYNPFLIFMEHLDNPRAILGDNDPRRRKYTYLIRIRISPKDKSIKNIRGDIHEVESEVRFSNISHV